MKTDINPSVLSWARQRNSLTVEQFAKLLSEDPAEVRLWEEGKSSPTYSTLETIAYRHLKVPIAVFYFPSPPDVDDPVSKFRRLPDFELERLSPDTLQIIRRVGSQALELIVGVLLSAIQILRLIVNALGSPTLIRCPRARSAP